VVGRGRQLAYLARAIAPARDGHGGAVLVCGPPGAGASTLCLQAAAASTFRVLVVRGVEGERRLDGAGLHDLVGVLDRGGLPALAHLRGDTRARPQPVAVAVAIRSLLVAAAREQPALIVVDDADRLDAASATTLQFCARRLDGTGVAMLIAARANTAPGWDGVERLELAGLDQRDTLALLRRHSGVPVSARVAGRIREATGGTPAMLRAAAGLLTASQLAGLEALPLLPAPDAAVAAWAARLRALPTACAQALVLAAVAADAPAAVTVRAMRELGLDLADLDRAVAAHDVRLDGGAPRLPDGAERTALLHAAAPSAQAAARRALARAWMAAGAADEAARELTAASLAADADAAAELAAAGRAARVQGAHADAAAALRAAASGTLDVGDRAALLLEAADTLADSGPAAGVLALAEEIVAARPPPGVRTAAELHRAHALLAQGRPQPARELLVAAASGVPAAPELLAAAAVASGMLGDVAAARQLSGLAGSDGLASRTRAWVRVLAGDPAGAGALRPDPSSLPAIHADYASWLEVAMWLELDGGALPAAGPPYRLGVAAEAALRAGNWRVARSRAEAAVAAAARLRCDAARAEIVLTVLDGCLGDERSARARAERVRDRSQGLDHPRAIAALGALELACGDPDAAAALLGEAHRRALAGGVAEPGVLRVAPDLIEALIRAGRHAEARRVLATLAAAAAIRDRHWIAAATWRCNGLLAWAGDVDTAFATAERHARHLGAFDRGRLDLAHGERLRRDGRRVEARAHLRAALERFDALAAAPWSQRAARELRVCGSRPPRPSAARGEPLTPQEAEVAQLVAAGRTNREAAAALFITRKTVEFHLGHIYRKLGVRSRSQLVLLRAGREEVRHTVSQS
jgi:DNA-binding CsgD family transcriptional regulator